MLSGWIGIQRVSPWLSCVSSTGCWTGGYDAYKKKAWRQIHDMASMGLSCMWLCRQYNSGRVKGRDYLDVARQHRRLHQGAATFVRTSCDLSPTMAKNELPVLCL